LLTCEDLSAAGWRHLLFDPSRSRAVVSGRVVLGQPDEDVIEVTLAADSDQTNLVWEERGMPLDQLAAYGAGVQIHVEHLAAHIAGRERSDAGARWNELKPAYRDLAHNID
jgi:hypothetical protein